MQIYPEISPAEESREQLSPEGQKETSCTDLTTSYRDEVTSGRYEATSGRCNVTCLAVISVI